MKHKALRYMVRVPYRINGGGGGGGGEASVFQCMPAM